MNLRRVKAHLIITLLFALITSTFAKSPDSLDVVYAKVGDIELKLDLYFPETESTVSPPLVVWIHGGAWRSGSKSNPPILYLLKENFAIASIDYRLSTQAEFPALIHDCKAAIRWLRANQQKYGYNSCKIAVAGSSAGGHIVALMGATNGSEYHEGSVGGFLNESSDVQAVIDYYGPTNFLSILHQSTPHGLSVRVPALQLLLGSQPKTNPSLAKLASPVEFVDENDPPLLMLHGDQDPQVPINQSHELHHQYLLHNLDVDFQVVHGGKHGGPIFHSPHFQEKIISFLNQSIR